MVGIASDKYGRKWFATIGFLLAVPIEVLFRLVTHNSLSQKVLLIVLLFLLGLSTTLIITPLTAELTLVAERLQRSGRLGSKGVYAQVSLGFNLWFHQTYPSKGIWSFQFCFCHRMLDWSALGGSYQQICRLGHYDMEPRAALRNLGDSNRDMVRWSIVFAKERLIDAQIWYTESAGSILSC